MIVVNPDDVAGFVNLENPICEHLIHPVIVRPPLPLRTTIGRFMLFVMEQSVQLMLGVPPPPGLVLQANCAVVILLIAIQPHWNDLSSVISEELPL